MFKLDPSALNPPQLQAVTHRDGAMLVLAGAGSGKTRVITYRIGHLIESGVNPSAIVAVSFTNKAAREMRERVTDLVGREIAKLCKLSTFHALGAEILRQDIDRLGYRIPFAICDTSDQKTLIRDVLKELHLLGSRVDPDQVLNLISRAKMALTTPNKLPGMRFNPMRRAIGKIFDAYNNGLRALNAVDFDDMIGLPVQIFRQFPEVLQRYQEAWQYLMVDEYQDTNPTQFELLQLLGKGHGNVFVVGDDDQSIYGFRGADSTHILSFTQHYPKASLVALEQNYRSTKRILDAANAVISHNATRHDKALWSAGSEGSKLRYFDCKDESEEANFIADEIQRMIISQGLEFGDFAILYRINPQSRALEEALRERSLPYRIVGGTRFYDRTEVRDIISLLKVCANPNDDLALRRIVNTPPRGLGPAMIAQLDALAKARRIPFFGALRVAPQQLDFKSPRTRELLKAFVATLEKARDDFAAHKRPLHELTRQLIQDLRYIEHIRNTNSNEKMARRKADNVEEVVNAIAAFGRNPNPTLELFLERVALEPSDTHKNKDEAENSIVLMTFHSSKGLEFPAVFMAGCEEGMLPHSRSLKEKGGIEEERRLCYVGITRAQSHLAITSCRNRLRHGDLQRVEPSRFLEHIPSHLIEKSTETNSAAAQQLSEMRREKTKERFAALKALFDE